MNRHIPTAGCCSRWKRRSTPVQIIRINRGETLLLMLSLLGFFYAERPNSLEMSRRIAVAMVSAGKIVFCKGCDGTLVMTPPLLVILILLITSRCGPRVRASGGFGNEVEREFKLGAKTAADPGVVDTGASQR